MNLSIRNFFVAMLILVWRADAQDHLETLKLAQELPKKISSCELSYRVVGNGTERDLRTLYVSGPKWFQRIIMDGERVPYSQMGFDGSQYWFKRGKANTTAWFSSKPITIARLGSTPLDLPYWWFFKPGSPRTIAQLQSEDEWKQIAAEFSYLGTARASDQEVHRFRLIRDEREFQVSFAKALGGFPIQVELHERGLKKNVLDTVETLKGPNGAIVGTRFTLTLPGQPAKDQLHVVRDSIKINEATDNLAFQFDIGDAVNVINVDQLSPSDK